jgi:hypothetical protein
MPPQEIQLNRNNAQTGRYIDENNNINNNYNNINTNNNYINTYISTKSSYSALNTINHKPKRILSAIV